MTDSYCVIFSTTGSREQAEALAELLVTSRLAACVQVSAISSLYTWKGELHREPEHLLMIKTCADRYDAVEAVILEHHTDEVPEIVQVPIERGLPAYLEWVTQNTQ